MRDDLVLSKSFATRQLPRSTWVQVTSLAAADVAAEQRLDFDEFHEPQTATFACERKLSKAIAFAKSIGFVFIL